MTQIAQLQGRELWMRFVTGRQLSAGEVRFLIKPMLERSLFHIASNTRIARFLSTSDAPTIAAVSLVERSITLNLTLWNVGSPICFVALSKQAHFFW